MSVLPESARERLPAKLFFRIGEVASLVGVEPHVLRYWEREFRSIRPTKSAKGQRVYSRKDVENLLRVRDMLYREGFTIAGAKKRLSGGAVVEAEAEEPELAPETDLEGDEPEPVSEPVLTATSETSQSVREKLVALRDEVEDFLAELSRPDTK